MTKYELVRHAGEVPYDEWAEAGVKVPIFDKDGTLTAVNDDRPLEDVVHALQKRDIGRYFQKIAVVSNNHDPSAVKAFARELEAELGIGVIAISRSLEMRKKPHPAMGIAIADQIGIKPDQMGVVGDRRYTDVGFGRRLGAARIALVEKAGQTDTRWVPTLRRLEKVWVAADKARGRAA